MHTPSAQSELPYARTHAQRLQGFVSCMLSVHVREQYTPSKTLCTLPPTLSTSPETKSQFLHCLQSERERWGGEQEEKSGIVVKRKPRCYQPTESHQGHCHVSVSVTQLSLISPSDCCDFAAMGYSVILFCVGTSDETQN